MLYRLRNKFNYWSFAMRTHAVIGSHPIPCDPTADCDVHTMLGARDVQMYLVAIKSLLRWCRTVRVTVHSDGSLSDAHIDAIKHHVPGVRIINAAEADTLAERTFRARPILRAWRTVDVSYRRVLDTELWSDSPKRIIMDADILVLNQPRALIQWIEHGKQPFLLGRAPSIEADRVAAASTHMQAHFRRNLHAIAKATGHAPLFRQGSTSGFYGCTTELNLDVLESFLSACDSLGLRMREWGGEQCLVIYLLSASNGVSLDPDHCFNFEPECEDECSEAQIVHFYGTHRFYRSIYPRLATDISRELAATTPPVTPTGQPLNVPAR